MSTQRRRMPFRKAVTALLTAVLAVSLLQAPEATAAKPTPPPTATTKPVPSSKTKAAKATEADCGGAVAFGTITTCEAIEVDTTDTFTITTTAANESLLLRADMPSRSYVNVTVNGDNTSCYVSGRRRCDLGAAGEYTLTARNYGSEVASYTLFVVSIFHGACTTLTDSDLSPAAAPRPTEGARGLVSTCFTFSGAPGDVMGVGDATGGVIYNAEGGEPCHLHSGARTCELSGPGPYRAWMTGVNGSDSSVTTIFPFMLFRLTNPTACPALPLAPFGDATGSVATGQLRTGTTTCRSITTTSPGLLSLRLGVEDDSSNIVNQRELYTQAGQRVWCDESCSVPAGSYTVLLTSLAGIKTYDFALAVNDLAATAGCAPEIEPRWDTPAPTRTLQSPVQLDCQPIAGKSGDRILVRLQGPDVEGTSRIVGPSGATVCNQDSQHDGCVLQGTGPFRVLSTRNYYFKGSYVLDIGRLNAPVGCAPVAVTSFGAPAPAAGGRCRELTVTAAGRYRVDASTAYSYGNGGRGAYKTDGLEGCTSLFSCQLQPGKYSLLAQANERVAVFPFSSTAGCVAQPADTYAAKTGTLPVGTQFDCLSLRAAAGSRVVVAEPLGKTVTTGWVVDAAGAEMCAWGPNFSGGSDAPRLCRLTGKAPFRAVLHRGPWKGADNYQLAVVAADPNPGCKAFPQSTFSAPGGTVVALRPDRFMECLAVPANGHSAAETVEHSRTGAIGTATTLALSVGSEEWCEGSAAAASFVTCSYPAGKAAVVLVLGSSDTASHRIARRDVTATAPGCTPVSSTVVGSVSGSGTIPDAATVRCFKVTGAATDQFVANVRNADDSIRLDVHNTAGELICRSTYEERCSLRGSAGYQVLAWNDPTIGAGGPFTVETYRVATAAGPAAECTKVNSAYGFGPITGELTKSKPSSCVTFPMAKDTTLRGHARNQTAGGTNPTITSFGPTPSDTCESFSGDDGDFGCDGRETQSWNAVVLLNVPEQPDPAALKYTMDASCETPLCGGATFGVSSVAPASAATGASATVTVKGKSLHLKDVVTFKAAGKPDLVGVVKSVSADRTAATVTVDLKGAAAGARNLTVDSFAGGSATLASAFTVTPPALANTKAPALVAPVQVGAAVKVAVGTWSPAATSYTYQWRDNGAAIRGAGAATYTPAAAMLEHKLSVTVTAARAGSTSTAVTTAAVVVAAGVAPKASKGPVVTGTVKVGKTVTASAGTWAPTCTAVKFQWYSAGKAVAGGTKASLVLTTAMGKKALYVAATCVRTGHASGVASTKAVTVAA
ncbi:hypothetical protein E1263_10695 [Kribbella antibiotica]|uniref:Ig-like domain-containing protein n=1 Tax=Kribbella antibiotica TaxID=190195 RepID=A0A4R4ZRL7_9ACTN|nr:hypothetical protein [Kribbella antibiotica]TDD60559.1 hypothetical protein E1263_10695 [Kribbella antibiotica]